VLRRDRPFDGSATAVGVADVIRYAATARRSLRGPLALEIEGPGDPLASPEVVLRSLSLLHERHPDILTGLVIDGPLLSEYAEDLEAFGLRYLVLRMDAATLGTVKRLVDGALYRGDELDREEASRLVLDAWPQALGVAVRHGLPVIVRFTLVPTVNADEVLEVARRAKACGAWRMQVAPHVPVAGGPLARAGCPTDHELLDARTEVARVFGSTTQRPAEDATLDWLSPERLQPVDLDALDAVDVLRQLPAPDEVVRPAPVLPPRRAQLVAVATRDGSLVDTPLQAAAMLRVYAVTPTAIRLLGSRPLPLDPRRRHDGVGSAQAFLAAVVGCRAVVATHIPTRAATLLQAVGVRPVELGGALDEVLDRVARGTVREAGAEE
jgi:nitrogen fixation protein NifB